MMIGRRPLKPGDEFDLARRNPAMTLGTLKKLHLKAHGFVESEGNLHEWSHLILGLARIENPQNCWEAETLVFPIEEVLSGALLGVNGKAWSEQYFVDAVSRAEKEGVFHENWRRTLKHLIPDHPSERISFNQAVELAARHQMTLKFNEDDDNGFEIKKWSLKTSGLQTKHYHGSIQGDMQLPDGMVAFKLRDSNTIKQIFENIDPAVGLLIEKIRECKVDPQSRLSDDERKKVLQKVSEIPVIVILEALGEIPKRLERKHQPFSFGLLRK